MIRKRKGITIIELVVSISLISIVLVFLLRLLLIVKEMDDKSLRMLEFQEKSSLIMRSVQDRIKDASKCEFDLTDSNSKLDIKCPSSTTTSDIRFTVTVYPSDYKIELFECDYDTGEKKENTKETYIYPHNENTKIGPIINHNPSNPNHELYTIDIIDDKDHEYPVEISYYNM